MSLSTAAGYSIHSAVLTWVIGLLLFGGIYVRVRRGSTADTSKRWPWMIAIMVISGLVLVVGILRH